MSPTTYKNIGTILKPGPLGRLLRLVLGVFILYYVFVLLQIGNKEIVSGLPTDLGNWVGILAGIWVFPEVVNIGWALPRSTKPRTYLLSLFVLGGIWSSVQFGMIWGPPLGWVVYVWLLYTYIHLGLAFVFASIISTPGCEMRSIPHLWSLITGKETKEHVCPGFIDGFDKWESKKPRK